ncbi:MAG: hypothetical protein J6V01_02460, partial [Clostridia bacterium]|nr:hypothetical protein [Clostridia bacterium]
MFAKRDGKTPLSQKIRTLARIFSFAGGYRWVLASALILAAVFSVCSHMIPIFVGRSIDLAAGKDAVDLPGVARELSVIPILIVCSVISDLLMRAVSVKGGSVIIRNMRKAAFDRIQSLPLSYIDSRGNGELLSRIITDAERLSDGLVTGLCGLYSSVFGIAVCLVMMIVISPPVALAVVALTPVSMFFAAFISGRTYSLFRRSSEIVADETSVIGEAVAGSLEIKSYGFENSVVRKFDKLNHEYKKTAGSAVFFSSITNPMTRFVNSIIYCGVILAGGLIVLSGSLEIGGFVSLLTFARDYAKPFNDLSGILAEAQNSLSSAIRLFELIDAVPDPEDAPDAFVLSEEDKHGIIAAEGVSFSYDDKPFMSGISFEAKPGQKIAIV